jgi:hypothetical protein
MTINNKLSNSIQAQKEIFESFAYSSLNSPFDKKFELVSKFEEN